MKCLILLSTLSLFAAGPGKLVLNNQTIPLTHVYARQAPNSFDSKKTSYFILASSRELSPAERLDDDTLRELSWQGNLHTVELELTEGGVSWQIRSKYSAASLSGSTSPNPFTVAIANNRATGTVKMEKPSHLGSTEYYFEFPVDAPVETKTVRPAPTAADRAAAQNAASAKAYQLYVTALMKGDKAGLLQSVDPEKGKKIDTPEFPQILKFIQSMQPKNITVLRATETGETAELEVTGTGAKGPEYGTVKMRRIEGRWTIVRESWRLQ